MDFGQKIQNLRKEKGLSQEALASQLNVSRQAVSKWETGEGYPEIDKLLLISELFGVSLDYLMKDQEEHNASCYQEKYFMNSQKINDYMVLKNQFALRIASCVAMIILSVNIPILTYDTHYENLGAVGMLLVIALAVAILIVTGLSNEQYSELEKTNIHISFQDLENLQEQQARFKSQFGMGIAFGVFLIMISLAAIILIEEYTHLEKLAPIQLFVCVAIAVFNFIYLGMKNSMYHFLVQNEKYIIKRKQEDNSLFAITMPLAAMLYFVMGFVEGWWHPGWIIFPVTAILTLGIEQFIYKE